MADLTTAGTAPAGDGTAVPAAPEKTFTQADIDRLVGQRLSASKNEAAAALARATAAEAKAAEQAARIEALETATLTASEKAKRDQERAAKALEDGKAAADKLAAEKAAEAETARKELAAVRIEHAFVGAMAALKLAARPGTPEHERLRAVVLRALVSDVEHDHDDAGKITGVRYEGLPKKDLAEAVKAWAVANPWAIESAGGGSGSGPNGRGAAGGPGGKAPHEMTKDELARAVSAAERGEAG